MDVLRISSFFGYDLKVGALIVAYLGISFHLLNALLAIFFNGWTGVWFNLVLLIMQCCWLHAVIKENANYMLFSMILPATLSLMVIIPVYVISVGAFVYVLVIRDDDPRLIMETHSFFNMTFVFFAVFPLCIVIDVYIIMVKYSAYRQFIERGKDYLKSLDINDLQIMAKPPLNYVEQF